MGKLNCDVIRDLLPVYTEGEASESTNRLVEEHLAGCEECQKELKILQKDIVIEPTREEEMIARIHKKKKRQNAVFAIKMVLALVVFSAIGIGGYFLFIPYCDYNSYSPADLTFAENSEGKTVITLSESAKGEDIGELYTVEKNGDVIVYLKIEEGMKFWKLWPFDSKTAVAGETKDNAENYDGATFKRFYNIDTVELDERVTKVYYKYQITTAEPDDSEVELIWEKE